MPKGTKVDKCFQKLKKTKGEASAAAICQASTGRKLANNKPLDSKKSIKKKGK